VEMYERHRGYGEDIGACARCQNESQGRDFHAMQWATLFVLGAATALFHRLTAGAPLEARATLALGFLLLAAPVAGSLVARRRWPRLVGYLALGVIVGPSWFGLVRADEVGALRFVSDVVVTLIAFRTGAGLDLRAFAQAQPGLRRALLGTIAGPFALTAVVAFAVTPRFPLTIHESWGDGLAVALALGAFAVAASPVVVQALLEETGARGPLARDVVALAAGKEIAALVLLALALLVAWPLSGAGTVVPAALWQGPASLAGAIGAGVVAGWLLASLGAGARADSKILGLALVAGLGAHWVGLEPVLFALAAGAVLRRLAPAQAAALGAAVVGVEGPLFAVFFALAGAGFALGALADMWGWVVLFAGLRALGLYYGLRWAAQRPSVDPALAQYGWWGLVAQPGATVAFAALARRAFPEWGVSLEALVLAMIGVNEVAGAVSFRRALRAVGESQEESHDTELRFSSTPSLDAAP
jgi:Kef-type K+ transport system membrane component KefB